MHMPRFVRCILGTLASAAATFFAPTTTHAAPPQTTIRGDDVNLIAYYGGIKAPNGEFWNGMGIHAMGNNLEGIGDLLVLRNDRGTAMLIEFREANGTPHTCGVLSHGGYAYLENFETGEIKPWWPATNEYPDMNPPDTCRFTTSVDPLFIHTLNVARTHRQTLPVGYLYSFLAPLTSEPEIPLLGSHVPPVVMSEPGNRSGSPTWGEINENAGRAGVDSAGTFFKLGSVALIVTAVTPGAQPVTPAAGLGLVTGTLGTYCLSYGWEFTVEAIEKLSIDAVDTTLKPRDPTNPVNPNVHTRDDSNGDPNSHGPKKQDPDNHDTTPPPPGGVTGGGSGGSGGAGGAGGSGGGLVPPTLHCEPVTEPQLEPDGTYSQEFDCR